MRKLHYLEKRLQDAARVVLKNCLGVKKGEKAVVVTDESCRIIGLSFWYALKEITDPLFIEMVPRSIHGEEPPTIIKDILKASDVFLLPTSCSLTHTQARIQASQSGARGATMPGITVDIMMRTLNADYQRIAKLTRRLTNLLSHAGKAIIRTDENCELQLELSGRKGFADTGIIKKPGQFSNLPAGEAYIAPIESKSNGTILIDGSFAPVGYLSRPVRLEIRKGKIVKLIGNPRLKKIFASYGPKEHILAEFGLGTNYKAQVTGNVLEDEKVLGSIHIAFGNNLGFGGKNRAKIHLDGVVRKPSVWLDKRLIIKKGKILF